MSESKRARRIRLNLTKRYKDQIRHGQCMCCSNPRRNGWHCNPRYQEQRGILEEKEQTEIT